MSVGWCTWASVRSDILSAVLHVSTCPLGFFLKEATMYCGHCVSEK